MKRLASPLTSLLLIVSASFTAAAVAAAATYDSSSPEAGMGGDWTSALACTIQTEGGQASLVDEATCVSDAKDANGIPCVWCDATATIGTGLCLSADARQMAGRYWDSYCAASSSSHGSSSTIPTTPPPTPPPTNPPGPPGPAPAPDDGIPDELRCSMDASRNVISDEVECTAQVDADGNACTWCEVPVIGGTCVTSSMKSAIGFMCKQEQERSGEGGRREGENNNLRAGAGDDDYDDGGGRWRQLDPSCLGDSDGGLVGKEDACASRTDSNGEACVWCDAGNDVFGICATSDQVGYIGGYMNCKSDADNDYDADVVVAVE